MLSPATLTDAILEITDSRRPGHVFPRSQVEVAARWAAAVRHYMAELTPTPVILPPVIDLACDAGESAMRSVLEGAPPGFAAMAGAVQAFGAAFALSLTPALATPPPAPPVMPVLPPVNDPVPPAVSIAAAIDAWARTGLTAVPPAPPSVPWS